MINIRYRVSCGYNTTRHSKASISIKEKRRKGPKTMQTSLLAFREDRTYLLVARTNYNSGRCIQEGINISCGAAVGRQTFFIIFLLLVYLFFFSVLVANYDTRSVHSACGCITSSTGSLANKCIVGLGTESSQYIFIRVGIT